MSIITGPELEDAASKCLDPVPRLADPISVDVHVAETFELEPHSFHVVDSLETISMPTHLTAHLTGRSSHMRQGIFMPGGWVDPGYESSGGSPFVLEFFNMSDDPMLVEEGEAGARLVFHELDDEVPAYSGRWQG